MERTPKLLVPLAVMLFAGSATAQDIASQQGDGLVVSSSGNVEVLNDSNRPFGISTELKGDAADEAILRLIASNSSPNIDMSYRITDNIDINSRWFINGVIFPDQNAGVFSVLGKRIAFGGDLNLSNEQIAEINNLQKDLIDRVRNSATTRDSNQLLELISKETQEIESQILHVLLPHQREVLSEMIIRKLGLPGVLYYSHLAFENRQPADRGQAKRIAREELNEISVTVESLKTRVYTSLTRHLTNAEMSELERLVGKNLKEWFKSLPLETLIKQLEFVDQGAVPSGKSIREFIDDIRASEDR